MADALLDKGDKMPDHMPWFVYGFDSVLARGAVTAIGWLVKKPFSEKVTATGAQAMAEVKALHPDVDTEQLWAEIKAAVPDDVRLPYT